ncbi:hypothetical protein D037_1926A, partial [Vibrio parahaemolyticus IDH02640]
MNAFR